jgi:hypothetical protein
LRSVGSSWNRGWRRRKRRLRLRPKPLRGRRFAGCWRKYWRSTLNSWDGAVVANAAIVPAGTGGAINICVTNRTHVVLDIDGYFAP